MKKKAFFALFLAMVLALSSLAGCAGQTADSKNDSASGKTRPTTKGKEENSFTMALTNQVTTFRSGALCAAGRGHCHCTDV